MSAAAEQHIRSYDLTVGARTIRVHECGDETGPAILWLHGSGPGVSALSNWRELISTMPGFRHIAPDVIGFGESDYPDPAPLGIPASVQLRADAMLSLLDELGVEQTHVVGNSMGGMITLRMLLDAPARFDRVILMGTGGAPVAPTDDLISMITFYDDPSPERMGDLISRFVYDTALFGDQVEQIAHDRHASATRPQIERSHRSTFAPGQPPLIYDDAQLASIEHEVLVVHGREDRMIPVAAGYHFGERLPNAQLHVFPHAGHWVQIEAVARFRSLATGFLTETDQSKGD